MFVGSKRATGTTSRLGEILVEAGVISDDLVNQSLAIAKNSKLPIGRVLAMYGFTTEKVIESALAAQRGLRDGRFTKQQASQLVRVAHASYTDLDQAQSLVGLAHAESKNLCQVGKMLLAVEVLDGSILHQAEAEAKTNGQTVGQWLVDNEKISSQLLVNILHLLLLAREGSLPKLEAVSILQKIHNEGMMMQEATSSLSLGTLPEQKEIQLAAFFILAQFVEQRLVVHALEQSIDRQMFFGDILVEQSILTPETLEAGAQLRDMVEHEILTVEQACEIFAFVADMNAPLDGVLAEFERMSDIAKFIISTGLISESDCLQHGLSVESADVLMGINLLRTELINEKTVGYASHLLDLIKPGDLTEREAIGVFHYCVKYGIEPTEAIKKFGLKELQKDLPSAD